MLNMRTVKDDLRAAAVIRETAMRLFADRGAAAVTIREIAAAAGVSAGLVMHHYGSKDGLREAVDRRAVAFFEDMIGEFARLGEEGGSASLAELFAARVREFREQAGMTQRQVAERMSDLGYRIHQTTMAKIEAGTRPVVVGEAVALARIFGVSVGDLADANARLYDEPYLRLMMNSCLSRIATLEREEEDRRRELEHAQQRHDLATDVLARTRKELDGLTELARKEAK